MINRTLTLILLMFITGCSSTLQYESIADEPCSRESMEVVERKVITGDSEGHGPDVGSSEWYSVVERRLGIEGKPSVPKKGTAKWCDYVISKY